jgi:hypothetical protein
MRKKFSALAASVGALVLVGCSGAADSDYSQQRGISSDISASLSHGPTAAKPGMMGSGEPLGALPWELHGQTP